MPRTLRPRSETRPWRVYSARDGRKIERAARAGEDPLCPCCGGPLEPQSESRTSPCLVLDATSYEVGCRACHRFWCIVQHTQRSLRLLRMRRLAAAVSAVPTSDQVSADAQGPSMAGANR